MERLTERVNGEVRYSKHLDRDDKRGYGYAAMERLAAYEDTGLGPEEIVKMGMAWEDSKRYSGRLELKIKAYEDLTPIAHLRELVQAEQVGRLVNYLPGDTVYDRFGMAWTVTASEIHKFDDGPLRYLYRCGHPGTDDYCALYSNEILTRAEVEAVLEGGEE